MKQSIQTIVLILTVLSHATVANAQSGTVSISSTSPSSITLINASSVSNFAYVTLTGTNLSSITEARCTMNGAVQKLIGAAFQHVAIVKGKTTLQSFLDNPPIVIKVSVLSGTPAVGNYALEVLSNKQWMNANCSVKIVQNSRTPSTASATAQLSPNQKNSAALAAIQNLGANLVPAKTSIPPQLVKANTVPTLHLDLSTLPQATVTDYFPKDKGALGGTIVLIGTNLDSIKKVSIGTATLTFVKRIVAASSQQVEVIYRIPTGTSAFTGDLTYTSSFQLTNASAIVPNEVTTVEKNYQVVNQWTDLTPKVTVKSVRTFTNADGNGNLYPYQHFILQVLFENIAGGSLPLSTNVLPPTPTFLPAGDIPALSGDEIAGDAMVYYGNRFEAYVEGKSLSETLAGLTLSFTVSAVETGLRKSKHVDLTVPLSLSQPVDYTIENTNDLHDAFNFVRTSAWGQTDGTSDFGCGAIAVGEFNNGGDIAFRIASGPIGTEGRWQSNALNLADGWILKQINFEVSAVDPDGNPHVRTQGALPPTTGALSFPFVDPNLYPHNGALPDPPNINSANSTMMLYLQSDITDGDGTVYPSGASFGPMKMLCRPINIDLQADATLCNDHRITLTIKSIVLRGPRSHSARDGIVGQTDFESVDLNYARDANGQFMSAVRFF